MAKIIIKQDDALETPELKQEPAQEEPTIFDKKKEEPPKNISLNMRRGLDGRLMIFDHEHIDIIFLPNKLKVISFAKKDYSDIIYDTQTRLFDFLARKGLCSPETIGGGNVYGSIQGSILPPKEQELPVEHLLLLNIKKWLDSEKPALQADADYEDSFTKMMTEPDYEDSTELGEVPQEEDKGTIPKYASRRYIGGWWE